MRTITVYSKPTGCFACKNTVRKLDELGLPYTYIDITAPENADMLEDLKNRHLLQAPVVHVGDGPLPVTGEDRNTWTGYRPDKLAELAPKAADG